MLKQKFYYTISVAISWAEGSGEWDAEGVDGRDAIGVKRIGVGGAYPLASRLGGLWERRELLSGVQGKAPSANEFGPFFSMTEHFRMR